MKILIYSPAFYPSIGGLEAVVAMLADGLADLGCHVRVVTTTPDSDDDGSFRYEIIRSPTPSALLSLVRWCEVFFHHNVSLKGGWPLFFVRRPWLIAHHGWYTRSDGSTAWQDRLKLHAVRFATNIAVSRAVANHLPVPCSVIPNPYRDDQFCVIPDIRRDRDLVFLGRLVSDKGCDLLLDALGLLKGEGVQPALTVIGSGPEEPLLRKQAGRLGLDGQVTFAGKVVGEDLVRLLNRYLIAVIPSRWNEPFGIVALEEIACGCAVVASVGGGLPEAVGACGVTYPNGDVRALADRIKELLSRPEEVCKLRSAAARHLQGHQYRFVVQRYYQVLGQIMAARTVT